MKFNKSTKAKKSMLQQTIEMVKAPVFIALLITPLRLSLELMGIPEKYIFLIGLLWFTIGLSIYWGVKLKATKQALLLLLLGLSIFSPISRIPVALTWWVDTKWELGTHYGLYFDNFNQVLLNQVIYGGLLQIIAGFITGSITLAIVKQRPSLKFKNNTIQNG